MQHVAKVEKQMRQAVLAMMAIAVVAAVIWWRSSGPAGGFQRPASVVNVVQPRAGELNAEIRSVGTVQARASVLLTSEVDARLVKVLVEEGAQVKAGQKLAQLDDRVARAELVRMDARLKDAEAAWQRAEQLQGKELLSPAEVDTLQANLLAARADRDAAAANLADHSIVAPFAGVTGLRRVNQGSFVKSGDALWTLDDLDHLEVIFAVPERYIGDIRDGQQVSVSSRSYPDQEFLATVERIDTRVDSDNRTVSVKAALENPARLLRPGQFLDVALRTGRPSSLKEVRATCTRLRRIPRRVWKS